MLVFLSYLLTRSLNTCVAQLTSVSFSNLTNLMGVASLHFSVYLKVMVIKII